MVGWATSIRALSSSFALVLHLEVPDVRRQRHQRKDPRPCPRRSDHPDRVRGIAEKFAPVDTAILFLGGASMPFAFDGALPTTTATIPYENPE